MPAEGEALLDWMADHEDQWRQNGAWSTVESRTTDVLATLGLRRT
jgi:hypothetical protein